jgi:hypothetical protein
VGNAAHFFNYRRFLLSEKTQAEVCFWIFVIYLGFSFGRVPFLGYEDPLTNFGMALWLNLLIILKVIGGILALIAFYYLGGFILNFMKTLYVNWEKSEKWTLSIDEKIEKFNDRLSSESKKVYELMYDKEQLEKTIEKLKEELEEMKHHTGVKDKQNVEEAVDNFVGDFY